MSKAAKKEARRMAREERKAQEAERLRRAQRNRTAVIGVIAVVAVIVIGFAVWTSLRPRASTTSTTGAATPGQAAQSGQSPPAPSSQPTPPKIVDPPDQGRAHIRPGEVHPAYNSSPPASGWHFAATSDWGFHTDTPPDELVIHNLEHGGIWISYKDANDSAVVDPLVALAREFPHKVIITFRPKNDSRLAIVAWGHVMKLAAYNRDAIVDFIKRFKDKGPEFVPD